MACYRPRSACRATDGTIKYGQVRALPGEEPLQLPCGDCLGCRKQHAQTWAVRCVHESQMHERNSFVTLTFDRDHAPEDMSLDKRHWQLFAKRLRKRFGDRSFRYFQCGEYGDTNLRPHYHALIFGLDFSDDRVLLSERKGKRLYTSPTLEEVWDQGMVSLGDISIESACYVASYALKKRRKPRSDNAQVAELEASEYVERYGRWDSETGEFWTVEPEFVTMSRNPGIGASWFERYVDDVFPSDEVRLRGRRYKVPRYYDSKLPTEELEKYKDKRREAALKVGADGTFERLKVRERVAEATNRIFQERSL